MYRQVTLHRRNFVCPIQGAHVASCYIQGIYIPSGLAQVGACIDYRIPTHVWYACDEGKACNYYLDWRLAWTVREVWGKPTAIAFAAKARNH